MELALKIIIVTIGTILFFSFLNFSFNPTEWSDETRYVCSGLVFFNATITIPIFHFVKF